MIEQPLPEDDLNELLERIATQRCRASYEQLFKSVAPRLLGFGRKQLADDSLALELVQETMLKLWLKAHLFDGAKGAALTWIYSVARNVKFDLLRRTKHQRDWVQGDDIWPILAEDREPNQLEPEWAPVVQAELARLIHHLPAPQAEIIRLIYQQGASQQEAAQLLSLPLGTVKSRLRLALAKLKEMLDA
jgi:RNA polymerase sigma-70 factor (ECF subfamily)